MKMSTFSYYVKQMGSLATFSPLATERRCVLYSTRQNLIAYWLELVRR